MGDADLRERLVSLEVKMQHIQSSLDDARIETKALQQSVGELRDLLTQAKGARWMLLILVGLGGFISAKLPGLASLLGIARG